MYSRLKIRLKWLLKNPIVLSTPTTIQLSFLASSWQCFVLLPPPLLYQLSFYGQYGVCSRICGQEIGGIYHKNSNLTVTFENAIVPGWSDGKISFRKCFVSRRPKEWKNLSRVPNRRHTKSLQNEGTNEDEEDILRMTAITLSLI